MSRAFRIDMNGAQEPNSSTNTGLGVAVFDDSGANPTLEYTVVTRGLDWGPFTGRPPQTAATPDDVSNGHFHQAPRGSTGPVVYGWKTADPDDFTVTNLHLQGAVPVATFHGIWETTDPVSINGLLSSFNNPAYTLGSDTDLYANVHSVAFG